MAKTVSIRHLPFGRLWTQHSARRLEKPDESPGTPLGKPGGAVESRGKPRKHWDALGSPKRFWRALRSPGKLCGALGSSGKLWRARSGELWEALGSHRFLKLSLAVPGALGGKPCGRMVQDYKGWCRITGSGSKRAHGLGFLLFTVLSDCVATRHRAWIPHVKGYSSSGKRRSFSIGVQGGSRRLADLRGSYDPSGLTLGFRV